MTVSLNTINAAVQRGKEIYQPLVPLPELLIIPEPRINFLNREIENSINRYGFKLYKGDSGTYEVVDQGNGIKYTYPRTGTFNGLRILVSPELSPSEELFVKLHLFGHSIQLCSEPPSTAVTEYLNTADSDEKFKAVLLNYEYEAARYGLQLLYETRIYDLDRWFTVFVYTDHKMVDQAYTNKGIVPKFDECLVTGQTLVLPLPIPTSMKPRLLKERIAF